MDSFFLNKKQILKKKNAQPSIHVYVWCIGLRKHNPSVAGVYWSYSILYVAVGYIGLSQNSHPCTHLIPICLKKSERTKLCILQSLTENDKAFDYYIGTLFPIPRHLYMTHINAVYALSCSFFRKWQEDNVWTPSDLQVLTYKYVSYIRTHVVLVYNTNNIYNKLLVYNTNNYIIRQCQWIKYTFVIRLSVNHMKYFQLVPSRVSYLKTLPPCLFGCVQ